MKSLLFLSLAMFFSVSAQVQTELYLEAEVSPDIKLTRLDKGGNLDLFGGNEVKFQIESNTLDGVDVTVHSENNGVAKHTADPTRSLKYNMSSKINNGEWNLMSVFPNVIEISAGEFTNRKCDFSLKSEAAEDVKNVFAGKYTDEITITVKAHS